MIFNLLAWFTCSLNIATCFVLAFSVVLCQLLILTEMKIRLIGSGATSQLARTAFLNNNKKKHYATNNKAYYLNNLRSCHNSKRLIQFFFLPNILFIFSFRNKKHGIWASSAFKHFIRHFIGHFIKRTVYMESVSKNLTTAQQRQQTPLVSSCQLCCGETLLNHSVSFCLSFCLAFILLFPLLLFIFPLSSSTIAWLLKSLRNPPPLICPPPTDHLAYLEGRFIHWLIELAMLLP